MPLINTDQMPKRKPPAATAAPPDGTAPPLPQSTTSSTNEPVPPEPNTETGNTDVAAPVQSKLDHKSKPDREKRNKPPAMADVLIRLAAPQLDLWHDAALEPYATIKHENGREEHFRITDAEISSRLARIAWIAMQKAVNDETMNTVISTLAAMAIYDGEEHEAFLRVACERDQGHIHTLWLDLCNDAGEAVRITNDGWHVTTDVKPRFLRPSGMLPIRRPADPDKADFHRLFDVVNVVKEDRPLAACWMLQCLIPCIPFFGGVFHGGQGSGKTTSMLACRGIVDPNVSPSSPFNGSERDAGISLRSRRILAFDNLSYVSPEHADFLCRLSTGDTFTTRELHTDTGEISLKLWAPWCATGIPNVAVGTGRGDLTERSLCIEFAPIEKTKRMFDDELRPALAAVSPFVLSALLNAAQQWLIDRDEIREEYRHQFPRMIDAALVMTCGEPRLGFARGSFLKRHAQMANDAIEDILSGDMILLGVVALANEPNGWTGTYDELLENLGEQACKQLKRATPKALAAHLKRNIGTLLATRGVTVKPMGHSNKGNVVRLDATGETIPLASAPKSEFDQAFE